MSSVFAVQVEREYNVNGDVKEELFAALKLVNEMSPEESRGS